MDAEINPFWELEVQPTAGVLSAVKKAKKFVIRKTAAKSHTLKLRDLWEASRGTTLRGVTLWGAESGRVETWMPQTVFNSTEPSESQVMTLLVTAATRPLQGYGSPSAVMTVANATTLVMAPSSALAIGAPAPAAPVQRVLAFAVSPRNPLHTAGVLLGTVGGRWHVVLAVPGARESLEGMQVLGLLKDQLENAIAQGVLADPGTPEVHYVSSVAEAGVKVANVLGGLAEEFLDSTLAFDEDSAMANLLVMAARLGKTVPLPSGVASSTAAMTDFLSGMQPRVEENVVTGELAAPVSALREALTFRSFIRSTISFMLITHMREVKKAFEAENAAAARAALLRAEMIIDAFSGIRRGMSYYTRPNEYVMRSLLFGLYLNVAHAKIGRHLPVLVHNSVLPPRQQAFSWMAAAAEGRMAGYLVGVKSHALAGLIYLAEALKQVAPLPMASKTDTVAESGSEVLRAAYQQQLAATESAEDRAMAGVLGGTAEDAALRDVEDQRELGEVHSFSIAAARFVERFSEYLDATASARAGQFALHGAEKKVVGALVAKIQRGFAENPLSALQPADARVAALASREASLSKISPQKIETKQLLKLLEWQDVRELAVEGVLHGMKAGDTQRAAAVESFARATSTLDGLIDIEVPRRAPAEKGWVAHLPRGMVYRDTLKWLPEYAK